MYHGVPASLIEKIPSDGLCGKTDEDSLKVSYDEIDNYIRFGECKNPASLERILELHARAEMIEKPMTSHKFIPMA